MAVDPRVWGLIKQGAIERGLDPIAVGAVALSEGGLRNRPGDIGDLSGGGSYGPFQLYAQGALPSRFRGNQSRADAWAWSPAGINYALDAIAKVAAGKRGRQAISHIVRRFERPAAPGAEIERAWGYYQGGTLGDAAVSLATGNVGKHDVPGVPGTTRMIPGAKPLTIQQPKQFVFDQAKMSQGILDLFAEGGGEIEDFSKLTGIMDASQKWVQPPPIKIPGSPGVKVTTPGIPGTRTTQGTTASAAPAAAGRVDALPLGTKLPGGSEFNVSDPEGAPSAQGGRYHSAKDWFSPGGSGVFAPEAGKVVEVRPSTNNAGQVYGGTIKVQTADGRVWVFRHVAPGRFREGQKVDAGTRIASVVRWRDNPRSSHAHIELWKTLGGGYNHENMLDPMDWFR